jgi:1-acyl-sn-glycerol-3-phosphate acyltransferase
MIHKPTYHFTLLKYYARVTQIFSWPIPFVFFNVFFKLKITGRENLKEIKSPFIIISNHISYYDSFSLRLIFGIFTLKLPLRLMAVKEFNSKCMNFLARIGIIDIVYALFGVFVVVPGLGIKRNLEEAIGIIKNGGNVVMYPEGSIMEGNKIGEFKKGAAVLALKTGAPVLPISMRLGKEGLFRREFIINIGNVIKVDQRDSSITITQMFFDIVNGLYKMK